MQGILSLRNKSFAFTGFDLTLAFFYNITLENINYMHVILFQIDLLDVLLFVLMQRSHNHWALVHDCHLFWLWVQSPRVCDSSLGVSYYLLQNLEKQKHTKPEGSNGTNSPSDGQSILPAQT
jgi:hypothetical protein